MSPLPRAPGVCPACDEPVQVYAKGGGLYIAAHARWRHDSRGVKTTKRVKCHVEPRWAREALQRYGETLERDAVDLEAKATAARAKATLNHTETQALLALVKRG